MESIKIIEASKIALKMVIEESASINFTLKNSTEKINIVTNPTILNLKIVEENNNNFKIKTILIPGPQGPPGNSSNLFESSQGQICTGSSAITYNVNGYIESIEYSTGITKTFTYDNTNKLLSISITDGNSIINKTILYDIDDNIIGFQINEL